MLFSTTKKLQCIAWCEKSPHPKQGLFETTAVAEQGPGRLFPIHVGSGQPTPNLNGLQLGSWGPSEGWGHYFEPMSKILAWPKVGQRGHAGLPAGRLISFLSPLFQKVIDLAANIQSPSFRLPRWVQLMQYDFRLHSSEDDLETEFQMHMNSL